MKNVTVYSKDYCPYCKAAKAMLQQKGISFTEIDVLRQADKLPEMLSRSGRRTVPQIFFDDEHVGGYTDLVAYFTEVDREGNAA